MKERPRWSRNTLKWHMLEKIKADTWVLNLLPPYYGSLFAEQEPGIMSHCTTGWRDSKSGKSRWAFFHDLTQQHLDRIERFIADYEHYVILDLNKNTKSFFADELDSCLAIDYNFSEARHGDRTEIGLLVYHAKWKRSIVAAEELVGHLTRAIGRVPTGGFDGPCCLSFVPPGPHKKYDLPRVLVNLLAQQKSVAACLQPEQPLVQPTMTVGKPAFKDLSCEEKITHWEKLLRCGVELSGDVAGRGVYVIDDLYQSGATLWSYAKHLKALGAKAVFGLACEKSWRDRDNR